MKKHVISSLVILLSITFLPTNASSTTVDGYKPSFKNIYIVYYLNEGSSQVDTIKTVYADNLTYTDSSRSIMYKLVQKVKKERNNNREKSKIAHKFYNPFKFIYTILGL